MPRMPLGEYFVLVETDVEGAVVQTEKVGLDFALAANKILLTRPISPTDSHERHRSGLRTAWFSG